MTHFPDVMVDLETTSTSIEHGGIIQIAAVKFNLSTQEVDSNVFDRCLYLPGNRIWDMQTFAWWQKQKAEVFNSIQQRAEEPGLVTQAFHDWLGQGPHRLWAKPSHFEFPFLTSYFTQYGLSNPFHYREVTDMNSYIRGKLGFDASQWPQVDMVGNAHNALMDTLHQIKVLFECDK